MPNIETLLPNISESLYTLLMQITTAKHPLLATLLDQIPAEELNSDCYPFFYANPIFVGLLNKNKLNGSIKTFYENCNSLHAPFVKEFYSLKRQTEESGTLKSTLERFKKYKKVVTRFPPEPSGYLHLGHAKAALLNHYFATECNGTLRLRFDDTNPLNEEQNYVDCIIEDLKLLNITNYELSFTSDYFDILIEYAKELIRRGKAYCDNTDVETMRMERNNCIESKNRNLTVEQNIEIFEQMLNGNDKSCLRAKIDMLSKNKALCDPVIYRNIDCSHHKTGNKYRIYPTYDFACPIIDSIEDVTCALRTNEYRDRNEQYYWVLDSLNLRKPDIVDFSKLVFENTILSKRKLKEIVETKGIEWDDPRMPTLRGIKRLGMRLEALKNYILLQGMNDKITKISWDKIWAFNKKELEKTSGKYFAINKEDARRVKITNFEDVAKYIRCNFEIEPSNEDIKYKAFKNQKNKALGHKTVSVTEFVFIANEDYVNGEEITLMNLGNFVINEGTLCFVPDGDFKKTRIKTQWVSDHNYELSINEYENLFINEEFNKESKKTKQYIGEIAISECKVNDVVQFERDGFFYCDKDGFNIVPYTRQQRKK